MGTESKPLQSAGWQERTPCDNFWKSKKRIRKGIRRKMLFLILVKKVKMSAWGELITQQKQDRLQSQQKWKIFLSLKKSSHQLNYTKREFLEVETLEVTQNLYPAPIKITKNRILLLYIVPITRKQKWKRFQIKILFLKHTPPPLDRRIPP